MRDSAKRVRWLSLVALALVLVAAACARSIPMPEELVGSWSTQDGRYADRWFDLSPDRVVFGTGGSGNSVHVIDAVYRKQEGGRSLYTVVYRADYGEDRLELYHDDGGIVFRSQPGVHWLKGGTPR